MRAARKDSAPLVKNKERKGGSRPRRLSFKKTPLRKLPPADLREFYGTLSEEEAAQMIRDIEEAFEQVPHVE